MELRRQRHETGAGQRAAGANGDELLAVHREGDRISRYRQTEVHLPQNFAGILIERTEAAKLTGLKFHPPTLRMGDAITLWRSPI